MPIEASSSRKPALALISKTGPNGGGASMVACQLHELLQDEGSFSADHWTGDAQPVPPRISLRGGRLGDLLFRASRIASRKAGYPDFTNLTRWNLRPKAGRYSIYHIHDTSSTISPLTISHWSRNAPLIWTFHDCSPFTGGCIYPLDCPTYLHGCGDCPQLERWPLQTSIDRTRQMIRYKLKLINERVTAAVCPSQWIADEAVKAGVRKELLHVIHNAVDTSLFRPFERQLVRQQLGLPIEGDIVVLASASFSNPYKGTARALQAIAAQKPGLNVLMIGQRADGVTLPAGSNYLFRDFTSDRNLLAAYYAASDVLLFPSLAENFSLVLIEAMACGIPAVAFDTGGVREIVEHEVNGWIARYGDTEVLSYGLRRALEDSEMRTAWGENARKATLAKCSEQRFLQAHLSLYRRVLAGNAA
jgi:glycosyltransferase involved in cell wall biosynthesis